MAYVLVGEPGNGKTFFVEYLCSLLPRSSWPAGNRKYTFRFKNLDKLGHYGKITDHRVPDLRGPHDPGHEPVRRPRAKPRPTWPARSASPTSRSRPCTTTTGPWAPAAATSGTTSATTTRTAISKRCWSFVEIISRCPLTESLGTVTGKYPAKDKITSSAVDLLGEESIQRLLHITDTNNPYRFDLRRGALARVAGGGIHFSDEIFKNKKDLVQVYLGVIQNRTIEIDGYKWPIDTLIIATSNNSEFNRFLAEKEEAPIVDRCRICYVSHNTNYKLQKELTAYAIGSEPAPP
jgi:serine protein kinase